MDFAALDQAASSPLQPGKNESTDDLLADLGLDDAPAQGEHDTVYDLP